MENFKNSVAIIGAGISGLALGVMLNKQNIKSVIFEKSSSVSEYGAGISISKNPSVIGYTLKKVLKKTGKWNTTTTIYLQKS